MEPTDPFVACERCGTRLASYEAQAASFEGAPMGEPEYVCDHCCDVDMQNQTHGVFARRLSHSLDNDEVDIPEDT